MGGSAEKWQDITHVWAHLAPQNSGNTSVARQKILGGKFKITVRYREDLLAARLIIISGRNFKVLGLKNKSERHDYLIFDVLEGHLSHRGDDL
jgi:SPP1 family predicted phage head-tail adaptor